MAIGSLCTGLALVPLTASAGVLSALGIHTAEANTVAGTPSTNPVLNSQKMPVVVASNMGPGILGGTASDTSIVITNAALEPSMGPVGNASDAEELPDNGGSITFYTVQAGDTVGSIAQIFDVTKATILAANNLSATQALKPGTILTILPISGKTITIKKGDTVKILAKKFGVDPSDVSFYNNLTGDQNLVVGETLLIPDPNFDGTSDTAQVASPVVKNPKPSASTVPSKNPPVSSLGLYTTNKNGIDTTPITIHPMKSMDNRDLGNALLRPVAKEKSRRSQGAHGWGKKSVDLAAPLGTPIVAAADGVVVLARTDGWNGGYGSYVIIMSTIEGGPVQTIYAHMSKVIATTGQTVTRGQLIGLVGMTGDATGDHLHFEVRGALNPLSLNSNYTGL